MTYISPDEMRRDINMMLIVLQALTSKNTEGADLLHEWVEKYRKQEED